ncbi:MarR family transcriptional regulator [Streptomyces sp. NPDC056930]|uniref:MarR family transcriptional regulator n=1 Tax=Streptomyces sp. NPDC056930 TaxID=3345967 RepID=UPI003633E519
MLLPERERYIAGYVDHLPEGAAMDIKSLARSIPPYGQMAGGSALRALGAAGHLRHAQCRVEQRGQVRWVTRTFWSRTARDNEWWGAFLDAENDRAPQEAAATTAPPPPLRVPAEAPAPQAGAQPPTSAPVTPAEPAAQPASTGPVPVVPQQRTPEPALGQPSPAYLALARLGRLEPRLALSAADCAVLEPLATQWFARGVDPGAGPGRPRTPGAWHPGALAPSPSGSEGPPTRARNCNIRASWRARRPSTTPSRTRGPVSMPTRTQHQPTEPPHSTPRSP